MSDPAALLASLMGGQQARPPVPLMGSTLPLRESPDEQPDPRELLLLLLRLLQQASASSQVSGLPPDLGSQLPAGGTSDALAPGASNPLGTSVPLELTTSNPLAYSR